jgi:hypothetical protein
LLLLLPDQVLCTTLHIGTPIDDLHSDPPLRHNNEEKNCTPTEKIPTTILEPWLPKSKLSHLLLRNKTPLLNRPKNPKILSHLLLLGQGLDMQ